MIHSEKDLEFIEDYIIARECGDYFEFIKLYLYGNNFDTVNSKEYFNNIKHYIGSNFDKSFILACTNGHLKLVKFIFYSHKIKLIDIGLQCSSKYGHISVVDFLIKKGADVHSTNARNSFKSARKNGHLDILELFRINGFIEESEISWS
jgi:hypothetical protein